ncbi:nuclear transport factor 2 family protein [Arthrobacter sp. APC 3897]|uniref:nuclear transport factor 2 family protein n=1 Tax=Arthrobacter sp. APC 3897 TaxID=3035204 RepID=UPI0025B4D30B|nr:nuclear transport factor 2 family protein [Arthrobacter sp. APC 3897]MDN3480903.1 nuclear transport factor 2 family protein [Arthrobacter sp. APC 3897]
MTTPAAQTVTGSDVEQLIQLMHRYSSHLDAGRLDELVSLFADDGVWDGSAWGLPEIRGTGELRSFFADTMSGPSNTLHLVLNHIIDADADADTATGSAYFHVFSLTHDGTRRDSLGIYTDRFVRTARGWKFARRSVGAAPTPPAAGR